MLLERIYDEDLAQASYFISCQEKGEAMVVDARRDIQVYRDLGRPDLLDETAGVLTPVSAVPTDFSPACEADF